MPEFNFITISDLPSIESFYLSSQASTVCEPERRDPSHEPAWLDSTPPINKKVPPIIPLPLFQPQCSLHFPPRSPGPNRHFLLGDHGRGVRRRAIQRLPPRADPPWMAGRASSVERVKERATGLDKFVLREARGSSAEVTLPSPSPI